jgi:hypothetical protein
MSQVNSKFLLLLRSTPSSLVSKISHYFLASLNLVAQLLFQTSNLHTISSLHSMHRILLFIATTLNNGIKRN